MEAPAQIRFGQRLSHFALLFMIVFMPFPLHWVMVERELAGLHQELTGFNLYLSDFPTLLLLLSAPIWLWRQAPGPTLRKLTLPMTLLVLLSAVSSVWAFDVLLVLQLTLRLFLRLASTIVIIRLRPDRRLVQASLSLALFIQVAAAMLQFWSQDDLGLRILGEPDVSAVPGQSSILATGDEYWLRAYGLTPHPNILGGVITTITLALIAPAMMAGRYSTPIYLTLLLMAMAALFFSFSRAAWLGGVAGGIFLTAAVLGHRQWRRRFGRKLLLFAVAIMSLLTILGLRYSPLLAARLSPGSSKQELRSIDERRALIQAGRALFQLSPLMGIGAGNTSPAILPLVRDIPDVTPQPIHNTPFLLAVELGLGGAFLWLWLMLAPPVIALHYLRQGRLTPWALGLTAALVAFAVIDFFDFYAWGWTQGRLLRWLLWGLWTAEMAGATTQPQNQPI